MRSEVRYAITGLFIILLSVAMIAAIMWMTLGTEQRATNRYVIYLNESVAGLAEKSPVKMRGVDVGQVSSIKLDRENPSQVEIMVDLYTDTPVLIGTRAQLILSAITSIGYVELSSGTPGEAPIEPKLGAEYPEIPTTPSLPSRLEGAFETMTDRVEKISRRITSLLSVENVANISTTLENITTLSETLASQEGPLQTSLNNLASISAVIGENDQDIRLIIGNLKKITTDVEQITGALAGERGGIEDVIKNLEAFSANLESFSGTVASGEQDIEAIIKNIRSVSGNLDTLTANIAGLSTRLDKSLTLLDSAVIVVNDSTKAIGTLANDGSKVIRRFSQQMMPAMQSTLNELDRLSQDGQQLLEGLIDRPQSVIFGHPSPTPGPGE